MTDWDRARHCPRRSWPEPPRSAWGDFCEIIVTWVVIVFGICVAMVVVVFTLLAALAPYIFATIALLWIFGVI